jgi:PAS domain S-box-containing protein
MLVGMRIGLERETAPRRLLAPGVGHGAVIMTDAAGIIRYVSTAAEELVGHSAAELVDRSICCLHEESELAARTPEGKDDLHALFGAVRDGAKTVDRERWTYVRSDGGRVSLTATVSAVFGGTDEVVAFAVLCEAVDGP